MDRMISNSTQVYCKLKANGCEWKGAMSSYKVRNLINYSDKLKIPKILSDVYYY